MSPRCVRAMCVCRALALFGDAKQAMGEGKSGPVETGLTGPVATALLYTVMLECIINSEQSDQVSGIILIPFFLQATNVHQHKV